MVGDLADLGWERIGFDPDLLTWARAVDALTDQALVDPDLAHWWVCERTWFVGVDALDNDEMGTLPDTTRLPSTLRKNLTARFGDLPLHKAQLSVIRPGYPRPRDAETKAAFAYRKKRDAAHVDGLKAQGVERARMVKEPHAYILGIPVNNAPVTAAPLVIWQGSHQIMRAALSKALSGFPENEWGHIDLTRVYQAARRQVFDTCPRVVLHAAPGEAYLMHRLAVHGMASWEVGQGEVIQQQATDTVDRRIAYFRPDCASIKDWLEKP